MKVEVVLHHYSDGSPNIFTTVYGVYSNLYAAYEAIGDRPTQEAGIEGGEWFEVEEWEVEE